MHETGVVEMTNVCQHPAFAVVKGMIVGAGDHVDAEPFQVFEQLRIGGHERALRNAGGAFVPGVHGAFEIGEGRVCATQNFSECQEPFFIERR